jgi:hypothetical protein
MRRSVPAMPRMRAGARARISEKLMADLATVWEEHGQSVRTPGNLDPDEWAILRRVDRIDQAERERLRAWPDARDDRERI